jgi:hypothetical protein
MPSKITGFKLALALYKAAVNPAGPEPIIIIL